MLVSHITNQWRVDKNLTKVSNPRHPGDDTAKASNQNGKLFTLLLTTLPRANIFGPRKNWWLEVLVFSNGPLFWENSFIFGRVSFLVVDRLISIWHAVRCFVFKGHQVIDLKMTQQNLHHQMLHGLFAYAGSGSIVSHMCLNVGEKIPTRSIWVIVMSITCQFFFPFKVTWSWSHYQPICINPISTNQSSNI